MADACRRTVVLRRLSPQKPQAGRESRPACCFFRVSPPKKSEGQREGRPHLRAGAFHAGRGARPRSGTVPFRHTSGFSKEKPPHTTGSLRRRGPSVGILPGHPWRKAGKRHPKNSRFRLCLLLAQRDSLILADGRKIRFTGRAFRAKKADSPHGG